MSDPLPSPSRASASDAPEYSGDVTRYRGDVTYPAPSEAVLVTPDEESFAVQLSRLRTLRARKAESIYDLGRLLLEMHDTAHYRARYKTWLEFCRSEVDVSLGCVYMYMRVAACLTREQVVQLGTQKARYLAGVPEEHRGRLVDMVLAQNVTADGVLAFIRGALNITSTQVLMERPVLGPHVKDTRKGVQAMADARRRKYLESQICRLVPLSPVGDSLAGSEKLSGKRVMYTVTVVEDRYVLRIITEGDA